MSVKSVVSKFKHVSLVTDEYGNQTAIYNHMGHGSPIIRIGIPGYWDDAQVEEKIASVIQEEYRKDRAPEPADGWFSE